MDESCRRFDALIARSAQLTREAAAELHFQGWQLRQVMRPSGWGSTSTST